MSILSNRRQRAGWGLLLVLALAIPILLVSPGAFSRARAGQEPDLSEKLRFAQVEKVQLVLVPATVTDKKGRPVLNLTQDDFTLFDDDEPREIEFFATESNAPVALAFLLDVSGSMRQPGKLDAAKSAIGSFLDSLEMKDRFGLICFADHQVTWVTPFTSDAATFRLRLSVQEGYGQTALYDALAASPQLVDEQKQARKAIVLFTDGIDNASHLPPIQAIWLARRVRVPIYTVSFLPAPRRMLSEQKQKNLLMLERFSRETGGELFAIQKGKDLDEAIARIKQDLRSQYVIGFNPPGSDDPSFRRIRLETRHSHLLVRTRTGYYPES